MDVRHYEEAQQALGSAFSLPPTPTDLVYFTNFLLGKKLAPGTFRLYLSSIRFYLMSRGIALTFKLPPLAEQLILWKEKQEKNAFSEAFKKTRRANTVDILKLLEHAVSVHQSWTPYERSLRWTVILLARWESFRESFFRSTNTSLMPIKTC